DAIVVAGEGVKIRTPVYSFMVMPMIAVSIAVEIDRLAVCHHYAALGTGDRFHKIERECAGVTDRAEIFSFIGCADTLAGIFQQQQTMFLTNLLQGSQVGHASAHMYRHHAFGP